MHEDKKLNQSSNKCDIIIPVFNAPDWLKLCVYALFANTPREYIGKVYLMNDNSNLDTVDCLNNLKNKYPKYVEVINNKKNLGFVKNVNKGLKLTRENYILLLNTDCLISNNTIPKLISHIKSDHKIGLICPVSSNAANLTLEIFEGFSYTQMDTLLERKFKGQCFDACTVVGNCLLLTRECFNSVGFLDEAYGMGYGEETDYHFSALYKGFKAKVAIDTYVFHKSEVSFGTSKEKQERLNKNRELFFSRWGDEYEKACTLYSRNDPIEYILKNITEDDKEIVADTLFYLPYITQQSGGCHVVFDIVNYLVIKGINANILYEEIYNYKEIALFKPICRKDDREIIVKQVVATIWISTFMIKSFANRLGVPIINLVQGYENYFENGGVYNSVELSHKIADYEITISKYLQEKIDKMFGKESCLIPNGVNCDLLIHKNSSKTARRITFVLRNNVMKGDYILADLIKMLDISYKDLEINVVYMNKFVEIPIVLNNCLNKYEGPLDRKQISEILKRTDIYVDASTNEGFGLMGLEAMACGAVPILSNSFGVNEYMRDGYNGFVINEVNNPDKYFDSIKRVIDESSLFQRFVSNGQKTSLKCDFDETIEKYIRYFSIAKSPKKKIFTKEEKKTIKMRAGYAQERDMKKHKSFAYYISKLIPNFAKKMMKKFITSLYRLYDHSDE